MKALQTTILLAVSLLICTAGLFPPDSVICQSANGTIVIESSCDCESDKPPCCSEEASEELTVDCHVAPKNLEGGCRDTVISVDGYIKLNDITVKKTAVAEPFPYCRYISTLCGENLQDTNIPGLVLLKHNIPPSAAHTCLCTTVLLI